MNQPFARLLFQRVQREKNTRNLYVVWPMYRCVQHHPLRFSLEQMKERLYSQIGAAFSHRVCTQLFNDCLSDSGIDR